MQLDLNYFKKFRCIIGCDEVGRGPLAGPVVGCAVRVCVDHYNSLSSLNLDDSKKLTEKRREKIISELDLELSPFKKFTHKNFEYCLWEHSPAEIDEMNILQASLSAMKNAATTLDPNNSDQILIDGNKVYDIKGMHIDAVVKGDSKSRVISLASIIAKVYRDNLMKKYGEKYPGYGLESHAGYPTKAHKQAIVNLGVTPIHRKSFKGVKEFI
jgi:ribonuclease HII